MNFERRAYVVRQGGVYVISVKREFEEVLAKGKENSESGDHSGR